MFNMKTNVYGHVQPLNLPDGCMLNEPYDAGCSVLTVSSNGSWIVMTNQDGLQVVIGLGTVILESKSVLFGMEQQSQEPLCQ